jgi:hypothetical protein
MHSPSDVPRWELLFQNRDCPPSALQELDSLAADFDTIENRRFRARRREVDCGLTGSLRSGTDAKGRPATCSALSGCCKTAYPVNAYLKACARKPLPVHEIRSTDLPSHDQNLGDPRLGGKSDLRDARVSGLD